MSDKPIGWPIDWRALVDEAIRRRKSEGLSQRNLAALAGVSTPTINAFERGAVTLRLERVVAILETLELFVRPEQSDSLQYFVHDARRRWQELIDGISEGDGPGEGVGEGAGAKAIKQPYGHSEQAYKIENTAPLPTFAKILAIAAQAPKTSGWPPFWVPTGVALKPTLHDGFIECWHGQDRGRAFKDAAESDFWRMSRDGRAYLQRGYQEDSSSQEPGTIFDFTLPIWKTAEVLLHAAWRAKTMGLVPDAPDAPDLKIRFFARYTGLAGRELLSWARPSRRFALEGRYRALTPSVDLSVVTTGEQIDKDLSTVVGHIVRPLYERFDGFHLSNVVIAGEIDALRDFLNHHPRNAPRASG